MSSVAQQRKLAAQAPYFQCPAWADLPTVPYKLDVYQGSQLVDSFDISDDKSFLFGRLAVCYHQATHGRLCVVHGQGLETNLMTVGRKWLPKGGYSRPFPDHPPFGTHVGTLTQPGPPGAFGGGVPSNMSQSDPEATQTILRDVSKRPLVPFERRLGKLGSPFGTTV